MWSQSYQAALLLVSSLIQVTFSQLDTTVCSQPMPGGVPGGPTKPNLPDQFQTRIELTIINKNQTTEIVEYFDGPNNRGVIMQTDFNTNLRAIYDYNDDEFIVDFFADSKCLTKDLATADDRKLMGYQIVDGKSRIYSAARALHWADATIQEVYAGPDVVRGINVDHWQSCQYWTDDQASMEVHWYFTSSTGWGTANTASQLPVRCWVKGKVAGPNPHPFEHYYEFFQFRDTIIDGTQVFEAPSGYICEGRVNTKDLPVPANAFSFTSEIIEFDTKEIKYMKEEFDLNTNLVRYTYRPPTSDLVTEIHDFNTGVAYVTDPMIGNCSFKPIETGEFDVKKTDQNHVRIRTANEFFSFDNTKYTYIGKHKVRQIDCDAWIATRDDWPPNMGLNSTWTWYFATSDWLENSGSLMERKEPISLKVEVPQFDMYLQYNMYNFHEDEPNVVDFDVSNCFLFRDRVYMTFTLPGVYNDVIANDRKVFKYSLLLSLIGTAAISPLRIAHLNYVMTDTNVTVEFEVLDVAPITGDIQTVVQETPLDVAVAALNDTILAGQFVVTLMGDETVYLVAYADSLQTLQYIAGVAQPVSQPSRYSPGALAAVGVTMPIVGGLIGALAAFFFFK